MTGILLRICGQMLGFGLALSAFALWLMPGAAEGLSLGRLMASLGLLLTGVSAVLLCEDRR
ncbi:hypothetical protein [Alloyangia pacifica]|uniref:hypothetical protein n=1 Tax=Alloyangia pacifica TaxID=311180 RepID=UPI001CFD5C8E|nr:hypothetical protein [Alloyangia pacifica]